MATDESKGSESICLGARLVVLLEPPRRPGSDDHGTSLRGRDLAAEGLLVVYQQSSSTTTTTTTTISDSSTPSSSTSVVEGYRIEIGTNHGVYQGMMDLSQIKLSHGNKTDIAKYLLQDGKDHPDITIQFQHLLDNNNKNNNKDDDGDRIQLIIKERLESLGLQKFVYTGTLSSTRPDGVTSRKIKPSLLQFCHSLGRTLNDSIQTIHELQQQVEAKDQSLGYWKATAQQLDQQVWQKEKDRLVHNFVQLWNERQNRAKKQLQDLQAELDATQAALQAKLNEKRKGRNLKLDEAIANAADEDVTGQAEPIPLDQVQALASGPQKQTSSTTAPPTILKQEDTVSMSTLLQQADDYAKRKRPRRAAATKTATTKQDTDDKDDNGGGGGEDSDTDDAVEPIPKRKPRRTKAETAKPTKKGLAKAPPKRNARKTSTQHQSTDSVGDGNDSPLLAMDSEDEALRAQIRARIQKNSPQPQQQPAKAKENTKKKAHWQPTDNDGNESPSLSLDSDDEALRAQIRAGVQRKPSEGIPKPPETVQQPFSQSSNHNKNYTFISSPNLSLDDDDDDDNDDQPMRPVDDSKKSPWVVRDGEDPKPSSQLPANLESRLSLSFSDED